MKNDRIFPLKGAVQHYQWGGRTFIPGLLGIKNPDGTPYAELWMGSHSLNPAHIKTNEGTERLDHYLSRAPKENLGKYVIEKFGPRLPFLFKILDVHKMLSIQAHPDKRQAEEGFQRENEMGVPPNAFHRVFRDDNHKPEVMVALTDFWLLHGFRSEKDIQSILSEIPELSVLSSHFQSGDLRSLYKYMMTMPQQEVNRILHPMQRRLTGKSIPKENPEYWARLAFEDYTLENGDVDRGIFSIFLLNLVHLSPGEGIFQDAGIPHAYLEGVNVELMANSDNVFRGGLTNKHVDVPALMAHLRFEPVIPEVLRGKALSECETVYPTNSPDFELGRITLHSGSYCRQPEKDSPQIMIVLEGTAEIAKAGSFPAGTSFYIKPGTPFKIKGIGDTTIFKAGVPDTAH